MHPTLGECITAYPTIPKGTHYSPVDNTVHMGAVAVAVWQNEALGVILLHNTMLPTNCGFPQMVEEWEDLLKSTCKKGNNGAIRHMKGFMSQVQNVHALQHTEAQQQVLNWMYPAWLLPSMCKVAKLSVHRSPECQAPMSPEHSLSRSPECPAPSVHNHLLPRLPEWPPLHADGWQARHELEVHLNMPKFKDAPEYWAEWIEQNLELNTVHRV